MTYKFVGSISVKRIKCYGYNSLPTGKSFQSNAQKFPRADKFYQGCYSQGKVREKQKFFEVREKSGNFLKSQGTLFSGAMHQGWQWAFKGQHKIQHKIKSPPHPMPCLTFCHLFQLNCMADRDSWYDLE